MTSPLDSKQEREKKPARVEPSPEIKSRMAKGTVYCFIAVLIIMNIIFRYPTEITHEIGPDTTFIHTLANSLAEEGSAKWVLNPASLFGFYALSYPSGVPFLLAGFSMASGVSIEGTILCYGMVLGIIGALGAFMVSREIFRNDLFAFPVALLFSLAPFFLKDTIWVGSSRGSVVALIPILLWLLVRAIRTKDSRFFVLSTLVFVVACSLHRMGILMAFFFISFFFISSLHRITQKIRFALVRYERLFRITAFATLLFAFFLLFYLQILFPGYGGFNIVEVYGRGAFFEGTDLPTMLLNMAINFVGKVGILIPFSLLGLFLYTWKRPKEIQEKFVLLMVFLLLPFVSLRDYISEFLILFFVLLAVFTLIFLQIRWGRRRKMFAVVLALFLVLSLGFSWTMKDYWRNKYPTDTPISESTFDTSVYFRARGGGVALTNFGFMAGRISAISGKPSLPLGGASTHWHGPQQLIFGTSQSSNLLFFDVSRLEVRRLEYDEITFNTDELFTPTNAPNALDDWVQFLVHNTTSRESTDIADLYDIHYVIIAKSEPFMFFTYGWRSSTFLVQFQLGPDGVAYKVYENTEETMWFYM
jgi:hypothetical protein